MTDSRSERKKHDRRVDGLRLVSSIALLIFALSFFRLPLSYLFGDGDFHFPDAFGGSPGFIVRVLSTPTGASVRIDGEFRGNAPLFSNVACVDDQPVVIEVSKPGLPVWTRTVACREGQTLLVEPRLERR